MFKKALQHIATEHGIDVLFERRLIPMLADYGAFKETPAFRTILKLLFDGQFLQAYLNTDKSIEHDQILMKFINKTGIEKALSYDLLNALYCTYKEAEFSDSILSPKVTEADTLNAIRDNNGCSYSADGIRLLSCNPHHGTITIKPGTKVICDNAFENANIDRIIIPNSIMIIGDNALPRCMIENHSPSYTLSNGLFMSIDKKRLLSNISDNQTIVSIPETIESIDTRAFYKDQYPWAYDYPPYFIKISSLNINHFETAYANIVVKTNDLQSALSKNGFEDCKFIVGDVYIDELGVVYSTDKRTLLCFPKESNLTTYEVLDSCENFADDAFNWLPDTDDGELFIIGNNLESLTLPRSLKSVGKYSLQGLTSLKEIKYHVDSVNDINSILKEYKDYYVQPITERVKLRQIV